MGESPSGLPITLLSYWQKGEEVVPVSSQPSKLDSDFFGLDFRSSLSKLSKVVFHKKASLGVCNKNSCGFFLYTIS